MNSIYPCLWFDGNAKDAAQLYTSIFPGSKIIADTGMVVIWEVAGKKIMGLNGGPVFKINPSISLFVVCATDNEIEHYWNRLSADGKIMMPLDKYPWSEKYGWCVDRFGMTWQLMKGELPEGGQKIIPSLLFVGNQYGKASDAIDKYTSIFSGSRINMMQKYSADEGQPEGTVKFAQFTLNGSDFAAMDGFGQHEFQFNEGVSFVVECESQAEIDRYWDLLISGGGNESRCGWLKDQFGVSWQIIPDNLGSIMTDPEKGKRAMDELMKMNKIDKSVLENA